MGLGLGLALGLAFGLGLGLGLGSANPHPNPKQVRWAIRGATIEIALRVRSTSWAGFGWSPRRPRASVEYAHYLLGQPPKQESEDAAAARGSQRLDALTEH